MTSIAPRKYSPEDRRQALYVYAIAGGSEEYVTSMLKKIGLKVNINTLRDWVSRRHKDEYQQIKQEAEGFIRSEMDDQFRSLRLLAGEVASMAMTQQAEALRRGEIPLKELPKVAQSAMIAAGVATDKGELIAGRPTERISHDAGESVRELAALGITVLVPGADGKPVPIDVEARNTRVTALPTSTD